jgi:hypothetical protein
MKCSISVDGSPLFSEEFVLIEGHSQHEARAKAAAKGESMNHSYANDTGEQVEWTFEAVLEVKETVDQELGNGAELYARLCSETPELVPDNEGGAGPAIAIL